MGAAVEMKIIRTLILLAFSSVAGVAAPAAQAYVSFLGQWPAVTPPVATDGGRSLGGLAVGPQGDVYEPDPVSAQVNIFSPTGALIGVIGAAQGGGDPAPGTFVAIPAVATDGSGNVYVLDRFRSPSVQRFDPSGRFETQFAGTDGDCLAACGQPTAMAVTAAGEVLVMLGAEGTISIRLGR